MNRRWQLRVIFVISVTILAVSMVFTINAQAIEGGMVKEGSVQEGREPIQVGEIETTQFFFSYPVLLSGPQTIQYPDAAYIKIHIAELDLIPGDYITITDTDGSQVYYYPGSMYTFDEDEGFWAISIIGDTAVVELHHSDEADISTSPGLMG